MLRALIFDFDGVIADTEPLHLRAFQHALREVSLELSPEDYFHRFLGLNDAALMRAVLETAGRPAPADELSRLLRVKDAAYFRLIATGLETRPGVADFIRRAAAVWPLAICSGARRREIETILAHAGLAAAFRFVVSADDVAASKPDPAGYLLAVERMRKHAPGLHPAECLAIEDSPFGLQAARAAGLRTLAVSGVLTADDHRPAEAFVDDWSPVTPDWLQERFD